MQRRSAGRSGGGKSIAGTPPSQRQLRVGEQVRHVLAQLLQRGEVQEKYLDAHPVTVTEVRMSPDLKNGTAFVIPLGGGDPAPMLEALTKVTPYLRHRVAQEVVMKYSPNLRFESDRSFDEASSIDRLLRDPHVMQDLDRSGD